jgi:ABC-type nitrate/sulfonate/bicarbonate transport system substrate-binding protein
MAAATSRRKLIAFHRARGVSSSFALFLIFCRKRSQQRKPRLRSRSGQRLAAKFRRHFPPGYFLINWRAVSPKFGAARTLEVGLARILEPSEGCGRKHHPSNRHLTMNMNSGLPHIRSVGMFVAFYRAAKGVASMTSKIRRREFIAALGVGLFAAPAIVRAEGEPIVIRAGALKLIHSIAPYFYDQFVPPGYKVEVIPFETPTDCKNAVVTKSIDFGAFGIAAAVLGGAAGESVVVIASTCNRGMAIIAKKDENITSIKGLKGKRVAVFPGTTQEVFFLERLRMEGMTIKDVEPVRVSFSEMHIALSRGDIDAYVGAEPGPGLSLSSGVGSLVEYPYSTAMGSLNMVFGTHRDVITEKPDLVRVMLGIHQRATDFASTNKDAMVAMASSKLGQKKEAIEASVPNVELTWRLGPKEIEQSKIYADHMLSLKQIKRLPDFATFIDTDFVDAMKPT